MTVSALKVHHLQDLAGVIHLKYVEVTTTMKSYNLSMGLEGNKQEA